MSKEIIAVICGGREEHIPEESFEWLEWIFEKHGVTKIIAGGARGVDRDAEEVALRFNLEFEEFRADWDLLGKKAGFVRNQVMVDRADICIAFKGGRGTEDTIKRSLKKGILVYCQELLD